MKTILLLLCSCVASKANNSFYDVICDESVDRGLYFEPVSGVRGRFLLKWCNSTLANKSATEWTLRLSYYTSLKPEQCNKDSHSGNHLHSYFEEPVQVNLNCTNVCFKATLDAIFSSTCYQIYTEQVSETEIRGASVSRRLTTYNHYHYVRENATNLTIQDVTEIKAHAYYENDGEYVILHWFPGIPTSQYEVEMSPDTNDTTYIDKKVYMNCSTPSPEHVRCRAHAAFGNYTARFRHAAPWTSLHTRPPINFHYIFYHSASSPLEWAATRSPLWWALGGAGGVLLLGAGAALLLLLRRAARSGQFKQDVRRRWLDEITRRGARARPGVAAERIVLLYARDCAHMKRAAAHLAALLQLVTGCEVVDLYRPETVSAAAPAAGPWLRALLQRAGTRVLLVQSPAVAMYCARLADDKEGSPTLEAPLLGSRVAWRRPHAADTLLLLALRFLADGAHHEPLPYKKYYVATVAGLQHGDVVPALTPQRRYPLPHAATELLRALAPPAPAADPPAPPADPPLAPAAQRLLQQLTDALEEFRKYALDNPDYLSHDLVLA